MPETEYVAWFGWGYYGCGREGHGRVCLDKCDAKRFASRFAATQFMTEAGYRIFTIVAAGPVRAVEQEDADVWCLDGSREAH